MTIWNPKEWEDVQEIYSEYRELLTSEIEIMLKRKSLVDRVWDIYYGANKYPKRG